MSKICSTFAPSFKKTCFGKLRRVGESSPFFTPIHLPPPVFLPDRVRIPLRLSLCGAF